MTFRENILAILNYQAYDKLPVISFGYWPETLDKWAAQGHITQEQADHYRIYGDNSQSDKEIMRKLGFDFNWNSCIGTSSFLSPAFESVLLETRPDGSQLIRDSLGLICIIKPDTVSIPAEVGTSLTDRRSWEELYLPKLQMSDDRIPYEKFAEIPPPEQRQIPVALHLGSLIGNMRNMLGVQQLSYLYADDEELFGEVVDTLCGLCYQCAKKALETGVKFDYAHYWEDICFKNGPLVSPSVFREYIGPWYRKIAELVNAYGVNIISVDCDGWIDHLIPVWLENGVNTMFPIEVGTWNASIQPWREKFGKELRGVGGMNKNVFSQDKQSVDREIERLKPLIALGGYLPCPDHRIAPDAKFELVQYYCEQMQNLAV